METKKGSKKPLVWNEESDPVFEGMKEVLLSAVGLHLEDPNRRFVLRTDASNYAIGAALEQVLDDGPHVPVAFLSGVMADCQRRTWTPREKEYAIVMALRKWAGYILLPPVTVCTNHQSLQSWHKENTDTPSRPAFSRARWHETLAKFNLTVVYVPGMDNTVADCLSRWAYPASKGMTDVSARCDEAETAEAKNINNMERIVEEEGVKCFVAMATDAPLGRRALHLILCYLSAPPAVIDVLLFLHTAARLLIATTSPHAARCKAGQPREPPAVCIPPGAPTPRPGAPPTPARRGREGPHPGLYRGPAGGGPQAAELHRRRGGDACVPGDDEIQPPQVRHGHHGGNPGSAPAPLLPPGKALVLGSGGGLRPLPGTPAAGR